MKEKYVILITVLLAFFNIINCNAQKYTDAEGDALLSQLNGASIKISQLQSELDRILRNPASLATIYFPVESTQLNPKDKAVLKQVAYWMSKKPEIKIILRGHMCNMAADKIINYNRLKTIENYLLICGVDPMKIQYDREPEPTSSFGILFDHVDIKPLL